MTNRSLLNDKIFGFGFGDNAETSVMPLFYATTRALSYKYIMTLKGDRIYIATPVYSSVEYDISSLLLDPSSTMVSDSNAIEYDLYTDPWKNYQVTHKGSMVTDWIATGANTVREGAWMSSFTSRGASNRGAVGNAESTPSNATSGYNTGFVLYRQSQYDFEAMRNTITSKRQTTMWGVY